MITLIGALIEAWEEVKINRARVILSLIGVGAAVWAMATVLALGSVMSAANNHLMAQYSGVPGTITISTSRETSTSPEQDIVDSGTGVHEDIINSAQDSTANASRYDSFVSTTEKFSVATQATIKRLDATYWTRYQALPVKADAPNYQGCYDDMCLADYPNLIGVDPMFFDIYGRVIAQGRNINDLDATLQMNPAVINETTWKAMGEPDIETFPRLWLGSDHKKSVTVVGIVRNTSMWDSAEIYVHADTTPFAMPAEASSDEYSSNLPELRIVAPSEQAKDAATVAASILQGNLGSGYASEGYFDESTLSQSQGSEKIITTIVSAIGGIVILLGALGLLTVSIVTVKTRVREIGIRRAVGASAKRIFFSVFLESVVATTVAGFFGVLASILTIRFAPFDLMGIDLGGVVWGYPMQAALIGVLISAAVGALCGIIPATTAVRMRPIDAIRF